MKCVGYKCYFVGDSDGRGIGKCMGNMYYFWCQLIGIKCN